MGCTSTPRCRAIGCRPVSFLGPTLQSPTSQGYGVVLAPNSAGVNAAFVGWLVRMVHL